jgi:hypothetical protein
MRALVDQELSRLLRERMRPDLDKIDELMLYGSVDFIAKYGLDEAQRINEYISDRPLTMADAIPVKVSSFLPPGVALLKNGDQWTLIKTKEPTDE